MGNFIRDEKRYCDISGSFAERNLPKCPFCGAEQPKWLWKTEWQLGGQQYGLIGRMYWFKCPECKSILKVREGDVTGYAFSKATFEGMVKKQQKKALRTVYVMVEKIGDCVKNEENQKLSGMELPLPELMNQKTTES